MLHSLSRVTDQEALDLILGKLEGVRQQHGYWMARCPAHEDGKASLSVARGTEQPVVLNCHAGCTHDAILDALGLSAADISKPRDETARREWTPHGDAVAVYDYTDEQGNLLSQVLRTMDKQFPQRAPDPSKKSGWRWNTAGVRRVPYRLPNLIAAVGAGQIVYVVEGEKDAQSIERAGAVATSSPGGAGKWRDEYDIWFTGAEVIIVADRDQPGREHAADVHAHLKPVAKSVVIVEPAAGKDVSDHLAAGHSLAELVAQRPASRALAVIDLEMAAETVTPPTLICRDKLYLGAVHTLSGPPDCGKTTLACWWMLLAIREELSVLFLDEEGGREIVVEKFQALGAQPGERIGYIQFPSRVWNADDIIMLNDVMHERKPSIVAWDSSAAFLARAGLDENAAADVTRFYANVLTPAARLHNAAVLVIDHDTKSGEPSRYARGSGAKLAMTDVAYKVAIETPFSRSESGMSKLMVTKDRRGWLHRGFEVAFTADPRSATAELIVTDTKAISGSIAGLTPVEDAVLDQLGSRPVIAPDLAERIASRPGGKRYNERYIRNALNDLARMGLASQVGTSENGYILWVRT
jgi:hypothetical protein